MSLAAVPVFLWGRSLMSTGWALAAAALTLALPGLAYSGLVMTEVALLPAGRCGDVGDRAGARATDAREPAARGGADRRRVRDAAAGAVLGAVLVTAVLLVAAFERRLAVVRELRLALGGLGVLALGWIVWRLARGGPASELFGAYRAAGETGYSVGAILRYIRWHAADLIVVTGVVPTCALVVLLVGAARGRERSPAARAFLAVAVSTVVWLVAEVGVFASVHVGHLAERDLLATVPLLFLALALWCDRGAPRPLAAAATAAALVLLLVAAAPVARLVEPAVIPDAFSLVPLVHLELGSPGFPLRLLMILLAAALVAAFWLVPRRALVAVPLVLVAALAALSVSATKEVADSARATKRQMLGTTPQWIDRHARGDVAFLYSGAAYPQSVWANLFWNHKLTQVVDLLDAHVAGPLPQPAVGPYDDGSLVLADGTGRPVAFDYAVAPQSLSFDGALVADEPYAQLGLWRVRQPHAARGVAQADALRERRRPAARARPLGLPRGARRAGGRVAELCAGDRAAAERQGDPAADDPGRHAVAAHDRRRAARARRHPALHLSRRRGRRWDQRAALRLRAGERKLERDRDLVVGAAEDPTRRRRARRPPPRRRRRRRSSAASSRRRAAPGSRTGSARSGCPSAGAGRSSGGSARRPEATRAGTAPASGRTTGAAPRRRGARRRGTGRSRRRRRAPARRRSRRRPRRAGSRARRCRASRG